MSYFEKNPKYFVAIFVFLWNCILFYLLNFLERDLREATLGSHFESIIY